MPIMQLDQCTVHRYEDGTAICLAHPILWMDQPFSPALRFDA